MKNEMVKLDSKKLEDALLEEMKAQGIINYQTYERIMKAREKNND